MKNITDTFGKLYHPVKAFMLYQEASAEKNIYVESYDMDKNGFAVNAHPLSVQESKALASALSASEKNRQSFLKPAGLLPKNVIYINPESNGFVLWHTPPQKVDLFFAESLGIPSGRAFLPPLLFKASKKTLWVYALKSDAVPTTETVLCNAPFFNLYKDGKVCMGTVKISIPDDCHLEQFIKSWEKYFFESYFSHLIGSESPVNGNIVSLWKSLVNTQKKFPLNSLTQNGTTLKKLLS